MSRLVFILGLLGLGLMSSCAKQPTPEDFGPWTTRVSVEDNGPAFTSDFTEAWTAEVRKDLAAVKAVLLEVLEDRKNDDPNYNDRLTYLQSKLEAAEDFHIIFQDDYQPNATIIGEAHLLKITRGLMNDSYTRRYALAHELGHLLSVTSYIGHRGTRFLKECDGIEFCLGQGQKFAPYTVDNYPFLPELKDLQNHEFQDMTGLEYLTPEQRPYLQHLAQEAMEECCRQNCQVNNLFVEEYANLEACKMLEGLYLNNAFQKAVRENKASVVMPPALNSRIDEVNADLFANLYTKHMLAKADLADYEKVLISHAADAFFLGPIQDDELDNNHPGRRHRQKAFQTTCFSEQGRCSLTANQEDLVPVEDDALVEG